MVKLPTLEQIQIFIDNEIDCNSRKDEHKHPRCFIYHFIRENYKKENGQPITLAKIGEMVGLKHETIINGIKQYNSLKNDIVFKENTKRVVEFLNNFGYINTNPEIIVNCQIQLQAKFNEL